MVITYRKVKVRQSYITYKELLLGFNYYIFYAFVASSSKKFEPAKDGVSRLCGCQFGLIRIILTREHNILRTPRAQSCAAPMCILNVQLDV